MKETMRHIINAARIIKQLPTETAEQFTIKKKAVDSLFTEIIAITAKMEEAKVKNKPNYYLSGFHIGNNGWKKGFTCVCGGVDRFDTSINVFFGETSIQVEVESDIDEVEGDNHPPSTCHVCD